MKLTNQQVNQPTLLTPLSGMFTACLIIASIANAKIINIAGFNLPGGIVLFPFTFIFNDILTEVYGYARSRSVIWAAFLCQIISGLTFWAVGALPSADFWQLQESYNTILGIVPRIVVASILAFFCGEFVNSFVLSKMKYWEKGAKGLKQGGRFLVSTIAGEAADTLVFTTIAFGGRVPANALVPIIVANYVFKVGYEIVALPLSTRFANWLKKVEETDAIDMPSKTNYNPFSVLNWR